MGDFAHVIVVGVLDIVVAVERLVVVLGMHGAFAPVHYSFAYALASFHCILE